MNCHHYIAEAESVQLNQYWELVNVNGRTVVQMAIDPPNAVHQFGGGASINLGDNANVDNSRLYYTVNVPEDCNYQLSLYTRAWDRIDGKNDLGNDVWVRIATGTDIPGETSRGSDYHKMFSTNNSNFQWAQPDHGTRFCKRLPAGQHVIEIAARSYHFQIDRVVLWCKEGCSFGNDWASKDAGDYNGGNPLGLLSCTQSNWSEAPVQPNKTLPNSSLWEPGDVIALHYDVAPDLDDLHAIAAGCNMSKCFSINPCVVIGAYGENRSGDYTTVRQQKAQAVADAAYGVGNYLDTGQSQTTWDQAVSAQAAKWLAALNAGNEVWVAEGGPSDFTREVIDELLNLGVTANIIKTMVHVVQHSIWNENETNNADLAYVQNNTDYTKIEDGNGVNSTADLNDNSNLNQFLSWANNSDCGAAWSEAFDGLPPTSKLDFSDTVEYLHILGIGKNTIATPADFCNYFD